MTLLKLKFTVIWKRRIWYWILFDINIEPREGLELCLWISGLNISCVFWEQSDTIWYFIEAYWRHLVHCNMVITGLGNGLLPGGTKSLTEPMLANFNCAQKQTVKKLKSKWNVILSRFFFRKPSLICLSRYSGLNLLTALGRRAFIAYYRKSSNIRRALVGNKIVDHPDVVGASPVGAAPTKSSFSTQHMAWRDSAKTAAGHYGNLFKCWDLVHLILETWR